MGLISRLSHIRCVIAGLTNQYPVAPVSNNAVVFISSLFLSVHEVTKASSAKKSPGNVDDDTINGFSCSNFCTAMWLTINLFVGFYLLGFSACGTSCSDFCMVMQLTLNSLFGFCSLISFFLLEQFIILWPISLHEKHFSFFISWSHSLITGWQLDLAVRIVPVLNLGTSATTTHSFINFSKVSACAIFLRPW